MGSEEEFEQVDDGSNEIRGRSNRNVMRDFFLIKELVLLPARYATFLSSVLCWTAVRSGALSLYLQSGGKGTV